MSLLIHHYCCSPGLILKVTLTYSAKRTNVRSVTNIYWQLVHPGENRVIWQDVLGSPSARIDWEEIHNAYRKYVTPL